MVGGDGQSRERGGQQSVGQLQDVDAVAVGVTGR
jgi:hypothetical protein